MKAFLLDRYGKKDNVRIADVPDPALKDNDVLVRIHAAGVNPLDSKIRDGEFKLLLKYRLPLILGHDLAGSWSGSAPASVTSSPATRCTRGPPTIRSAPSRNTSP